MLNETNIKYRQQTTREIRENFTNHDTVKPKPKNENLKHIHAFLLYKPMLKKQSLNRNSKV